MPKGYSYYAPGRVTPSPSASTSSSSSGGRSGRPLSSAEWQRRNLAVQQFAKETGISDIGVAAPQQTGFIATRHGKVPIQEYQISKGYIGAEQLPAYKKAQAEREAVAAARQEKQLKTFEQQRQKAQILAEQRQQQIVMEKSRLQSLRGYGITAPPGMKEKGVGFAPAPYTQTYWERISPDKREQILAQREAQKFKRDYPASAWWDKYVLDPYSKGVEFMKDIHVKTMVPEGKPLNLGLPKLKGGEERFKQAEALAFPPIVVAKFGKYATHIVSEPLYPEEKELKGKITKAPPVGATMPSKTQAFHVLTGRPEVAAGMQLLRSERLQLFAGKEEAKRDPLGFAISTGTQLLGWSLVSPQLSKTSSDVAVKPAKDIKIQVTQVGKGVGAVSKGGGAAGTTFFKFKSVPGKVGKFLYGVKEGKGYLRSDWVVPPKGGSLAWLPKDVSFANVKGLFQVKKQPPVKVRSVVVSKPDPTIKPSLTYETKGLRVTTPLDAKVSKSLGYSYSELGKVKTPPQTTGTLTVARTVPTSVGQAFGQVYTKFKTFALSEGRLFIKPPAGAKKPFFEITKIPKIPDKPLSGGIQIRIGRRTIQPKWGDKPISGATAQDLTLYGVAKEPKQPGGGFTMFKGGGKPSDPGMINLKRYYGVKLAESTAQKLGDLSVATGGTLKTLESLLKADVKRVSAPPNVKIRSTPLVTPQISTKTTTKPAAQVKAGESGVIISPSREFRQPKTPTLGSGRTVTPSLSLRPVVIPSREQRLIKSVRTRLGTGLQQTPGLDTSRAVDRELDLVKQPDPIVTQIPKIIPDVGIPPPPPVPRLDFTLIQQPGIPPPAIVPPIVPGGGGSPLPLLPFGRRRKGRSLGSLFQPRADLLSISITEARKLGGNGFKAFHPQPTRKRRKAYERALTTTGLLGGYPTASMLGLSRSRKKKKRKRKDDLFGGWLI